MHRLIRRGLALALVAALASLAAAVQQADAAVFSNPAPIAINTAVSGSCTVMTASPYPSQISVSGLTGTVTDVNVTLTGLSHTFPDDVAVLLVGPGGQSTILMGDSGGSADVNGVTLTFDDGAAATLPDEAQIVSGTYRPMLWDSPANCRPPATFPSPAPAGPYGSALSVFNGTDPNGAWSLYVLDDAQGDSGSISGGWSLDITAETTPEEKISDLQDLVAGMGIHHGITNALESKLQNALDALAADDTAGACYWMQSFVDLVNAQTGKKISSSDAQQLLDAANDIQTQLDC